MESPNAARTPERDRLLLLSLSITSGLLLGASFPPVPLAPLAFFGLVPLLLVIDSLWRFTSAMKYSYVAFLIFNAITLYWPGGFLHGNDVWMMVGGALLILVHPLFFLIPTASYIVCRNQFGINRSLFLLPFLWVAFEYLHSLGQVAFPWLALGNSQTSDLERIQYIVFTGVYGISFLIVALNAALYYLFRKMATREWSLFSVKSFGAAVAIVTLYAIPKFYGSWAIESWGKQSNPREFRAGIVQTNADPWEKWLGGTESQLDAHLRFSRELIPQEPDLIVWPETAMPFYLLHPRYALEFSRIWSFVDSARSAVLTGTPLLHSVELVSRGPSAGIAMEQTSAPVESYNGAVLVQPLVHNFQTYAKMILVPFAERVPYTEYLSALKAFQWNIGLGGWSRGNDSTVFTLLTERGSIPFATLICYESIYPGYTASYVRKGAEFLIVITIDSWWGRSSGPYQHLQIARLRAVENRRWIVRCASGGISCFIDPLGRVIDETELFTQSSMVRTIGLRNETTFYTRHGDLFAQGCTVLSGLGLIAGVLFGLRKRSRKDISQSMP